MIVTSGYSVMLLADRMVCHVTWQSVIWMHTLDVNKGVILTVNLK